MAHRMRVTKILSDIFDADFDEGGEWLLEIVIPERYPFVPPDMKFITPICHPNVHFKALNYFDYRTNSRLEKFVLTCFGISGVRLGRYRQHALQ